jgi:hypothetical protein
MNVVEYEYHFLLVCPAFLNIRKKYLSMCQKTHVMHSANTSGIHVSQSISPFNFNFDPSKQSGRDCLVDILSG